MEIPEDICFLAFFTRRALSCESEPNPGGVQRPGIWGRSRKVSPRWAKAKGKEKKKKHRRAYFNTWWSLTKTRLACAHRGALSGLGSTAVWKIRGTGAWAPKDLQPKHRHARLEMEAREDSTAHTIVTKHRAGTHTQDKQVGREFILKPATPLNLHAYINTNLNVYTALVHPEHTHVYPVL